VASYRTDVTQEQIKAILDYDPETGVFRWRNRPERSRRWNTRYAGTVAGQISNGYVYIAVNGKPAHYGARLAWLYMTGEWPPSQVDHINGVRGDDRFANLRAVTNAENNQNRGAQRNNIDGARGLSRHPTAGWRVRLQSHGVNHDLGYFRSRDEALAARKALQDRLHGEFAAQQDSAHGTYPYRDKRRG
jgi:hypothetical protein